jgi:hypothetical protein
MPRPAGYYSYFALAVLLTLPFIQLTAITTAASQTPPSGGVSHQALAGIWVLNRDLGDAPATTAAPEGSSEGRRGAGGGGGGGGRGGGRRMGGGGGRGYGRSGNQAEEDLGRRQAIADYVRASMDDSKQLTIVVHDTSVSITDVDGQVLVLQTNDKKIEERAGNGLVKLARKSRWDGDTLVSEIDVDNGPKIVRNYALSPGGTQLSITTTIDRGGRPVKATHVYERPISQ